MAQLPREEFWERRFAATPGYVFGTEPNDFLAREAHRIRPGGRVLAVADGEGRNGVYLATRGFDVLATEISPTAIAKARALAALRNASLAWAQTDVTAWDWPEAAFDAVVAIFVQFITPA
jgi:2-polyprenyl-3-methyl-5-hydroxy-6-metoxy-1,4-benzoquinol methylase